MLDESQIQFKCYWNVGHCKFLWARFSAGARTEGRQFYFSVFGNCQGQCLLLPSVSLQNPFCYELLWSQCKVCGPGSASCARVFPRGAQICHVALLQAHMMQWSHKKILNWILWVLIGVYECPATVQLYMCPLLIYAFKLINYNIYFMNPMTIILEPFAEHNHRWWWPLLPNSFMTQSL